MKRLVVAALLAVSALPTLAANLVPLNELQTWFVDVESIHKVGKHRRVWTITNEGSSITPGVPPYKSTRSLEEIDCEERSSITVATVYHAGLNGSGAALLQDRYPITEERRSFAIPGTPGDQLIRQVCRR